MLLSQTHCVYPWGLTNVLNAVHSSWHICKEDFYESCIVYIHVYLLAVFFRPVFVGTLLHVLAVTVVCRPEEKLKSFHSTKKCLFDIYYQSVEYKRLIQADMKKQTKRAQFKQNPENLCNFLPRRPVLLSVLSWQITAMHSYSITYSTNSWWSDTFQQRAEFFGSKPVDGSFYFFFATFKS